MNYLTIWLQIVVKDFCNRVLFMNYEYSMLDKIVN